MEFKGFSGFREEYPNIAIDTPGGTFDLHNAAELDGFEFDWTSGAATFRWTLHPHQWLSAADRSGGRLILRMAGVRKVRLDGYLRNGEEDARTLDFFEYVPGKDESVDVVLTDDTRISVYCGICEVRVVRAADAPEAPGS